MPNTVAYVYPVAGATPPTALEAKNKNEIVVDVTGDNSGTTIAVTHNWAISAADLANGFPEWSAEPLLTGGQAAALFRTQANNLTNASTFGCTAFTGAAVRIRLRRPMSLVK